MKESKEILVFILIVLFVSLSFSYAGFAGSSATFTAQCVMPEMVSTKTLEQETTQMQTTDKEMLLAAHEEKDTFVSKENSNVVQKTEEIVSETTKERQIIITVCAK